MAKTFEEAIKNNKSVFGASKNTVIKGKILSIIKHNNSDFFLLDVGLKLQGIVNVNEFDEMPNIGDSIDVIVIDEKNGQYIMSHKKAKKEKLFKQIRKAKYSNKTMPAKITNIADSSYEVLLMDGVFATLHNVAKDVELKIGDTVNVLIDTIFNYNVKVMLPNSIDYSVHLNKIVNCVITDMNDYLISVKISEINNIFGVIYLNDCNSYSSYKVGDKIAAKIIYFNNNEAILTTKNQNNTKEIVKDLEISKIYSCIVRAIKSSGLILKLIDHDLEFHIKSNYLSWFNTNIGERLKKFYIGQKLDVKLVNIEDGKPVFSLKDVSEHPYYKFVKNYSIGDIIEGKIVAKYDNYAFLSLINQIDDEILEGILYKIDLDIDAKKADEIFEKIKIGDKVKVRIKSFNEKKCGIILTLKKTDPFKALKVNETYDFVIKSILNEGIVIRLKDDLNIKSFISNFELRKNISMDDIKLEGIIRVNVLHINYETEKLKLAVVRKTQSNNESSSSFSDFLI